MPIPDTGAAIEDEAAAPADLAAARATDRVAAPARAPHRARNLALGLVGLVVAIGAVVGGLVAWDASYEGRVLPGVHVGSADLSGLDRAGAGAALAAAYPYGDGAIVLRTPDGDLRIPYSDIGRRPDLDRMTDAALGAGREGGPAERAIGEIRQALIGTTITPAMLIDSTALAASVEAAIRTLEIVPTDAGVTMGPEGPVASPAIDGRTADAAPVVEAALAAASDPEAGPEVVVAVLTTPVPPLIDDAAVAIARVRVQRMALDVTVVHGKRSWTITAADIRSWTTFVAHSDGTVDPVVDVSGAGAMLADAEKAILRTPVDATFLRSSGKRIIGAVAGKDGRVLDIPGTVARITAELQARANGETASTIRVKVTVLPPDFTTEEAAAQAPLMELLGSWTTWFAVSERNYFGANIWKPAQYINGTVLAPGQRFEWWSAIGPITSARGFGPGGIIRSDHTDPTGAAGGGMCSSSTTLFNAALRAGLTMGSRSNHKYYINRYPLGLDATVSKSARATQTMTFTNDTGHPLLIKGIKLRGANGRGYVRYEIWGVNDGRTVTISRPSVTDVTQATTRTVEVDTLPTGVKEQTEYPSNGMTVLITRTVRSAAGKVIHQETYRSRYVLWNGRIEVGR